MDKSRTVARDAPNPGLEDLFRYRHEILSEDEEESGQSKKEDGYDIPTLMQLAESDINRFIRNPPRLASSDNKTTAATSHPTSPPSTDMHELVKTQPPFETTLPVPVIH